MKVKRSSRRFIKPSCSTWISWEDFFRRPKRVEGSGVPLQLGPHLPQALSCALAMDSWDSFYFGKRWVQTCRGWFYWFGVWDVCSNCIFSSGSIMVLNLELTAKLLWHLKFVQYKSVWHFGPHVLSQFFPKISENVCPCLAGGLWEPLLQGWMEWLQHEVLPGSLMCWVWKINVEQ